MFILRTLLVANAFPILRTDYRQELLCYLEKFKAEFFVDPFIFSHMYKLVTLVEQGMKVRCEVLKLLVSSFINNLRKELLDILAYICFFYVCCQFCI